MGGTPNKSALGRSLGGLLRSPAEPTGQNGCGPGSASPAISPGVARLLRGVEERENLESETLHQDCTVVAVEQAESAVSSEPPVPTVADATLQRSATEYRAHALAPNEIIAWRRLVQASLIAADVILCGVAAWLAFSPGHKFAAEEIVITSLLVIFGGWLSCLALWLEP